MKLLNKITLHILVVGVLLTSSCENYLDVNENPNNPTDAPIPSLLTNTTYQTSLNVYNVGDFTSNYVQYLASPNPASSSDIMDPVNYSTTWSALYGTMTDLTDLIDKAEESGASHHKGAGQVLKALNLGMTVDVWGRVPYSESFYFETVTPAYDSDEVLYVEVIRLLDEGISNLGLESTVTMGTEDFIFSGDVDKWVKLGYLLKARFLNHLSKLEQYDPEAVLSALDKGFEGNEDDAQVVYFEQRFNPWAEVAIDNEELLLGGWISEQFIQTMDGTSFGIFDPRLPLMVGTTDAGEFVGTANGAGRGSAPEAGARSTLIPNQFYTSEMSPVLIATYAEQKFIEAEAAYGLDKTRSYEAYIEGIRAHMKMLGVNDTDIRLYLAHPAVNVGLENFNLNDIFEQKWIALFLHPESWNDARRFDYRYKDMTLPANLNPNLNGQFIRRLAYPDDEISRNGANVPSVTLLDRVWWDVQ